MFVQRGDMEQGLALIKKAIEVDPACESVSAHLAASLFSPLARTFTDSQHAPLAHFLFFFFFSSFLPFFLFLLALLFRRTHALHSFTCSARSMTRLLTAMRRYMMKNDTLLSHGCRFSHTHTHHNKKACTQHTPTHSLIPTHSLHFCALLCAVRRPSRSRTLGRSWLRFSRARRRALLSRVW